MSEADDGDKEHAPSQQKLDEARRRGDLPRSTDLLGAAAQGGLLLALAGLGTWLVQRTGSAGMVMLDQADRLAGLLTSGASATLAGLLLAFVGPPLLLMLVPGLSWGWWSAIGGVGNPVTGGTEGVAYRTETLQRRCFPELWSLRTKL